MSKTTTERAVEDALAHAETWCDSQEAKGERYVELLYDDTVKMINDLVLLAEEVRRLRKRKRT